MISQRSPARTPQARTEATMLEGSPGHRKDITTQVLVLGRGVTLEGAVLGVGHFVRGRLSLHRTIIARTHDSSLTMQRPSLSRDSAMRRANNSPMGRCYRSGMDLPTEDRPTLAEQPVTSVVMTSPSTWEHAWLDELDLRLVHARQSHAPAMSWDEAQQRLSSLAPR